MDCPQCDSEIDPSASYCPSCGLDIDALRDELDVSATADGEPDAPEKSTVPDDEEMATVATADRASASAAGTGAPVSDSSATEYAGESKSASPGGGSTQSGNGGNRSTTTQSTSTASSQRGALSFAVVASNNGVFSLGFLLGGAAYVLNYALVYALYAFEATDAAGEPAGAVGEPEMVGYLLYSAHTVDIERSMPTASEYLHGTDTQAINLLQAVYTESGADLAVPELAYYAVPVVGLLWAGRVVARQASSGVPLTQKQRGAAGAMVVLGYFALSMACALTVFTVSGDSVTTNPAVGQVATVMGAAYPLVVGGFAGYVLD